MFSSIRHITTVTLTDRKNHQGPIVNFQNNTFFGERIHPELKDLCLEIATEFTNCEFGLYGDREIHVFFPHDIYSGGFFGIGDVGANKVVVKPYVGHREYKRPGRYSNHTYLCRIQPSVNIKKLVNTAKSIWRPNHPDLWLIMQERNGVSMVQKKALETGKAYHDLIENAGALLEKHVSFQNDLIALTESGYLWSSPAVREVMEKLVEEDKAIREKAGDLKREMVLVSIVPDTGDNPVCVVHRNVLAGEEIGNPRENIRFQTRMNTENAIREMKRMDSLPEWIPMGLMQIEMLEESSGLLEGVGWRVNKNQYFLFDHGGW